MLELDFRRLLRHAAFVSALTVGVAMPPSAVQAQGVTPPPTTTDDMDDDDGMDIGWIGLLGLAGLLGLRRREPSRPASYTTTDTETRRP